MSGETDILDFDPLNDDGAEGSGQSWMVSFADLMALLLTFMVVGFSMKQIDGGLWEDVSSGLNQAFAGRGEIQTARIAPEIAGGGIGHEAAYVMELISARVPSLPADDIVLRKDGVAVRLGEVNLGELSELLSYLEMQVTLEVMSPLALEDNPVQQQLAWERAMQHSLQLSSEMATHGLSRDPDLMFSLSGAARGGPETWLVVNRAGGSR